MHKRGIFDTSHPIESHFERKEGVAFIKFLSACVTSEQRRHSRLLWDLIVWFPLLGYCIYIIYSLAKHGSPLTEDDVC